MMSDKLGKILWLVTMTIAITSAIILVQKPLEKYFVPEVEQKNEIVWIEKQKTIQPEIKIDKKQVACIRQALWHEARGEGLEGIKAVLSVIVNRVNSKHYPDTFCEVIHQPKQFSYVHELQQKGKPLKPVVTKSNEHIFDQINEFAHRAVKGEFKSILPSNVLWYTHTRISNYWTKKKKVVAVVGNHKFFIKKGESNGNSSS